MRITTPRGARRHSETALPADRPRRWRVLALRLAASLEQEVRARPALHSAFYAVISHSPVGRDLAGRVKSGVRRSQTTPPTRLHACLEDEAVRLRRDAAVAARLGLTLPEEAQ
jgi:hypothetical protein